jgi:hypothetical protein
MVIVAIVSFIVIRRRRRLLEQRAQLRYERLSRVELGDPPATSPASSVAGQGMGTPASSQGS